MKRLVLLLTLGWPGLSLAQALPLKVADGAIWTFVATHARDVSDEPGRSYSVTTEKKLTYHQPNGGSAVLHMEHQSVTAGAGMPQDMAFTQTLPIAVDVEVDEGFAPTGVVNVDQVREATLVMLRKTGAPVERLQSLSPQMLDQTSMALVGRELGLLGRAQNTKLTLGVPRDSSDEVASPLGGGLIRSNVSYSLYAYDNITGQAAVSWRSNVDEATMRASFALLADQAPPEKREAARADLAKLRYSNDQTCHAQIDIATGLAVRVDCLGVIAVKSEDKTKTTTDHWVITQTLPGKS